MDFITSAIASAVGSLGLEGVKHGYTKLKELLQGKFGEKSALVEAVEQLEKNPDSPARKDVVAEELAKVGADKDKEVLQAVKDLRKAIEAQQGGVGMYFDTVEADRLEVSDVSAEEQGTAVHTNKAKIKGTASFKHIGGSAEKKQ